MKVNSKAFLAIIFAVSLVIGWMSLTSQTANADGPWYVQPDGNDTNSCLSSGPSNACATIQAAVDKASVGDTVYVASGVYTGTSNEVVWIQSGVQLLGGWDESFLAQDGLSIIDGEGERKGIDIDAGAEVLLDHLAIQNTQNVGIYNEGDLVVQSCEITDGLGYGVYSNYEAAIIDSVIQFNQFGGIRNRTLGERLGGMELVRSVVSHNNGEMGIINTGALSLNHSEVSANPYGGVRNDDDGIATISHSAVKGNGGYGESGGVMNSNLMTVTHSVVYGNYQGEFYIGGITSGGTLTVVNSTVSKNEGGGIHTHWGDSLSIYNSTISDNIGTGISTSSFTSKTTISNTLIADNCSGMIASGGYNLIGSADCDITPGPGDQIDVNPLLGDFDLDEGVHPIVEGSPAINAGNPAGCSGPGGELLLIDQRGANRVGRCDIGAFEAGLSIAQSKISPVKQGITATLQIKLWNTEGYETLENITLTDTLPVSTTYVINSFTASHGMVGMSGDNLTWIGDIPGDETVNLFFNVVVDQNALACSSFNNTVRLQDGEFIIDDHLNEHIACICEVNKDSENPVLSPGPPGSWDEAHVGTPTVLKSMDTFMMWYTGKDSGGNSGIGLATSTDGVTWAKHPDNPVITPVDPWEQNGVQSGTVLYEEGEYKLWYTGFNDVNEGNIGLAVSEDGILWEKVAENPLIRLGRSGSWDENDVTRPTVIRVGGVYQMWYTGNNYTYSRIGRAVSGDGVHWIKDMANPMPEVGGLGEWDWLFAYAPAVAKFRDSFLLWYSGSGLPPAWQTGAILSSDGIQWDQKQLLIPEGPPGTFDAESADYPAVLVDGSNLHVWYSGYSGSGSTSVGYAEPELCEYETPPEFDIHLPIIFNNYRHTTCPAFYSDSFNNSGSGWPISNSDDRQYSYVSGEYEIYVKNADQMWMVTPGALVENFTAEVDARRVDGLTGAYGIVFGIDPYWDEYHLVLLDQNQYSIWKYDGGWTVLKDWTNSDHIATGLDTNHLKMTRNDEEISVYVNGYHLTTIADEDFIELRRIGLVAMSSPSKDLKARFDNFTLSLASCDILESLSRGVFEFGQPGYLGVPAGMIQPEK